MSGNGFEPDRPRETDGRFAQYKAPVASGSLTVPDAPAAYGAAELTNARDSYAWAIVHPGEDELAYDGDPDEWDEASRERADAVLTEFLETNRDLIEEALASGERGYGLGDVATDFALARNAEWGDSRDGRIPADVADRLAEAARAYGEQHAETGADGRLYLAASTSGEQRTPIPARSDTREKFVRIRSPRGLSDPHTTAVSRRESTTLRKMRLTELVRVSERLQAGPDAGYVETGWEQRSTILDQIGMQNVLAISGGRSIPMADGVELPVSGGFTVQVRLQSDDTYTVSRVRTRGGVEAVMGEQRGVFADQVSRAAYLASCFQSHEIDEWMGESYGSA